MEFETWYDGFKKPYETYDIDIEAICKEAFNAGKKAIQVEAKVKVQTAEIANLVPTNWLDPLLTGKEKVIGEAPYNNLDIQNLLLAVKERIKEKLSSLSA